MLPCSASSSRTFPTCMISGLRVSPTSSVNSAYPWISKYQGIVCSEIRFKNQRLSTTPISRSILPAAAANSDQAEGFGLQFETVKQCKNVDSLLILSQEIPSQDLDPTITTSLLRQAATLARLQKGHGLDTDSKRDLMTLLVQASMNLIKVFLLDN